MRTADVVVVGGTLVTMDAARTLVPGGAVAVLDGAIVDVGTVEEVRANHPGAPEHDATGCVVTPGFVDAHQHLTGDRLVRASIPDDIESSDAIYGWAVPLHTAHEPDDDELTATLAALEAVTNGVTTVIEAGTVAHPERVAAGLRRVGVRGSVGTWGWDVEGVPFGGTATDVLARQEAVLDALPPGGLVTGWVTLVGHDMASDELFAGAADLARRRGARLTFHISPDGRDPASYLERTGVRPLVHLDRLGILGEHLLLAHAVHLDDAECELLLASGTAVAYCPWAYVRLGQGVAAAGRHLTLAARGARMALGCDSENAGDQIDVLRAAALAAGLANDRGEPGAGAHLALELATVRGAEAVGLGDVCGSIEVGKRADLVVFDPLAPTWLPPGADPALQLVWGTDGRSVRDVFVDGRLVVAGGTCTTADVAALAVEAADARGRLLARSGVEPAARWPARPMV